ncbi:50S ribosomal protein L9 [Synechocystis sp. CACIAM 05]|uniref:50S ribosomal protein L9 n=1 Tax=Synechocystis sp. CACIAM 05 TaxID=1933929 RepID=UPI00138E6BAE|nr:50S ribosomal protein L9 [Synechocystis sp. CACIAM 05]QHV01824.1 50S ribosomal protein L9 [Synechocystis sp. CACIAM 05]
MAKRVKVVLNETINKLGFTGDLVEVAPGYARNYLIPKGLGVVATPGILRQVEQRRLKELERLKAEKDAAEARKVALETIGRFVIKKQVGEAEAIFGTVTTQEVADAVEAATNQSLDRRGISLPEINKTGFYQAQIKLHPEVIATVEVQVAPL